MLALHIKDFLGNKLPFPRFKSKKKSNKSFYVDTDKIKFTTTHVKLEKLTLSKKRNRQSLNWIRLAEVNRIPIAAKYINPRVTFDGLNWWISVGIEYPENEEVPSCCGIGIDLGIKNLAVVSDGNEYSNINKTQTIKKLKRKRRRLQRRISRKYKINKKGVSYCKTSNIIKAEKILLKLNHRLTNIRHNYINQATTEIVNRKPRFIVMEALNVSGMMKNKHLSEAISEQCFYEFKRQIEYKSSWNNIRFIEADRFYPSSKMCSYFGNLKKDLKLKDRIYKCDKCQNEIDRDKNAGINLKTYGDLKLN